jgi:hypothetical protein
MGDSHDAAAALANHPRWVAVHENLLARLGIILAAATDARVIAPDDFEAFIREMDEARELAEKARGVDMDAPQACEHFWITRDTARWCALCGAP